MDLYPQLPSDMEQICLNGIGLYGGVLNFKIAGNRSEVKTHEFECAQVEGCVVFEAEKAFNKVGGPVSWQAARSKFDSDAQISLTLEVQQENGWKAIAWNWMSHVTNGQKVWVTSDQSLNPKASYRLRIQDFKVNGNEDIIPTKQRNLQFVLSVQMERGF